MAAFINLFGMFYLWLKSSPAPLAWEQKDRKANLETRVWKSSEWNTKTYSLESLLDYTSAKHHCKSPSVSQLQGRIPTPTRNTADGPEH